MNRKIEIIKNCIAELINYLLLFAIGTIVQADFTGAGADFAGLAVAGLVPLLFYGVRERCGSFWLFSGLHLFPWAVFWLFYKGGMGQRIWMFLLLALFTGMSLKKKLSSVNMGAEEAHPVFAAVVLWVLYLIDGKMSGGRWGEFLLYVGIGFTAGYFLRYFLHQFLHYMDVNNRTTENIPAKHVFRSAILLAGGFTGLTGVVMALGSNRALLDRIGEGLYHMFVRFLGFLFTLLLKGIPEEEEAILEEAAKGADAGLGMLADGGEPSLLARIFEAILEIAVVLGLIALAAVAVISLVRLIQEIFSRIKEPGQSRDESFEDLVEKLEKREKKQRHSQGETFFGRIGKAMSPEERIRRIYRKAVEKEFLALGEEQRTKLREGATPREWCMELFPEQEIEAMDFARLYEKARYGRGLCGGEDVKRARKLAEGFHR